MLAVRFKPSAQKKFLKLPKDTQKRIVEKLEFYTRQPDPLIYVDFLTDLKIGKYRFRIGNYRVIFDLIDQDIIMILDVDHRKDIYR